MRNKSVLKTFVVAALAVTSLAVNARQIDIQICYRIAHYADYAARAGRAGAPVNDMKWTDGADDDPIVAAAKHRALMFSWVHNAPGVVALEQVVPECSKSVDGIIRAQRGW